MHDTPSDKGLNPALGKIARSMKHENAWRETTKRKGVSVNVVRKGINFRRGRNKCLPEAPLRGIYSHGMKKKKVYCFIPFQRFLSGFGQVPDGLAKFPRYSRSPSRDLLDHRPSRWIFTMGKHDRATTRPERAISQTSWLVGVLSDGYDDRIY